MDRTYSCIPFMCACKKKNTKKSCGSDGNYCETHAWCMVLKLFYRIEYKNVFSPSRGIQRAFFDNIIIAVSSHKS